MAASISHPTRNVRLIPVQRLPRTSLATYPVPGRSFKNVQDADISPSVDCLSLSTTVSSGPVNPTYRRILGVSGIAVITVLLMFRLNPGT